jgi:CelD/BcsL family acetyltransferase involved in cellulose biosynthesis
VQAFRIVRSLPEAALRSRTASPDANVFHTAEMLAALDAAQGYKAAAWAGLAEDGRLLALLPVAQVSVAPPAAGRLLGRLQLFTTRSVAYGSILVDPSDEGAAALDALLAAYNREAGRRALFTELRNLSDTTPWRAVLERNGYVWEDHLNFLIDLTQGADRLSSAIRTSARRNIAKAQREGVRVVEAQTTEERDAAYVILQGVYRRLRVPLADRSLFDAAFDLLRPAGKFKAWLACIGEMPVGVMTWLLHGGRIIYWYTGVDKAYSAYRANDLLVWHALEWGSNHGYTLFDFGGAGRPDEEYGVRDFKAKFGGELVNLGRYRAVHHPALLRASETAYGVARRFMSR